MATVYAEILEVGDLILHNTPMVAKVTLTRSSTNMHVYGLEEVRDEVASITRLYPHNVNPMQEDAPEVCAYERDGSHCIAGQVAANFNLRMPTFNGTVDSVDVFQQSFTSDAIDFLRRAQIVADGLTFTVRGQTIQADEDLDGNRIPRKWGFVGLVVLNDDDVDYVA